MDKAPSDARGMVARQSKADAAIQALTSTLRVRLTAALGAKPIRLHGAVFYLDDFGIAGVYVNPPLIAGISEEKLGKLVKTAKYKFGEWLGKDCRDKGAWNLEDNPIEGGLEEWGDPSNLYDAVVSAALYLACAQLEARPMLKPNVEVLPSFRALFVFHDSESDIDVRSRALAARHALGPARAYFDGLGITAED